MKNILLLPGTDAIELESFRCNAFQIQEVREMVEYTQSILSKNHEIDLDLVGYMVSPNDLTVGGFQKLVMCSIATQVALCRKYEKEHGNIDGIMGLSLGDTARSVVAGICTYEDGVAQLYDFTRYSGLVKNGFTLQIKLSEFDQEEDLRLLDFDLEMSIRQNDRFFLIAGETKNVLDWTQSVGNPLNIKYRPLYPFPLHSSLMQPVADKISKGVSEACKSFQLKYKVFSTVYAKEITTREEIIKDCRDNIASTLHFTDTINYILSKYQYVTFVNIGPAPTLKYFIQKMNLNVPTMRIEDYFEFIVLNAQNQVRA